MIMLYSCARNLFSCVRTKGNDIGSLLRLPRGTSMLARFCGGCETEAGDSPGWAHLCNRPGNTLYVCSSAQKQDFSRETHALASGSSIESRKDGGETHERHEGNRKHAACFGDVAKACARAVVVATADQPTIF